tara:strand:- start:4970 stop:5293 length:324 start_codon:yes stop_codon:yes gene_type:complete
MTGTIQGGTAQITTFDGPALALTYSDCQSLIISAYERPVYISYSEGGLQSELTRFKLQKVNDASAEGEYGLVLTFNTPSSGTLYFASANATNDALVTMWAISCGKKY